MSLVAYMLRFAVGLFVSFRVLFAVTDAFGQSHVRYDGAHVVTRHVHSYPVGFGFGRYHASTAAEGYLRGKAAVIEAAGNFEVLDAQAQILREQARALDRQNDLKQTAALHAQKKMWADARAQERREQELRATQGRELLAQRRATVYRQAYQLSADELNLITGEISWPDALRDARFESHRTRVEELFQRHVGYGRPQANTVQEISRAVDQLGRALRSASSSVAREEYVAAQKFLTGLKYGAASVVEST
jgi:hypothetical protein